MTQASPAVDEGVAFGRAAVRLMLMATAAGLMACNGHSPDRAASAAGLRDDATSARFAHPPPFESPSRAAAARGSSEAANENVARLEKQVARLEHDVTVLRAELAGSSGASQPLRAPPDLLDRSQLAATEAAFREEALDPPWSASMTTSVRAILAQGTVDHGAGRSVECRSHSCRVELEAADGDAAGAAFKPVLARLEQALPRAQAGELEDAEGRRQTVLYLSR